MACNRGKGTMQTQNQDNSVCSPLISPHAPKRYRCFLTIGYGLYRTLMDIAYATAMATVLNIYPLDIANLEFSLIASLFIMLCSLGLIFYGLARPSTTLCTGALPAMIVLITINICSACGLFSYMPRVFMTIVLAGVYGITSIIANTAWLSRFASLDTRYCLITLVGAICISSLLELVLAQLPPIACTIMLTIVGTVSVVLFIRLQYHADTAVEIPSDDEMPAPQEMASARLRSLLLELWRPLLVYVSLTLLSSLVAVFMGETHTDTMTLIFRSLAPVAAAAVMACIAGITARTLNVRAIFLSSFPLIALLLVAIPFFGDVVGEVFRIFLSFLCSIVNISMLFLLLETARLHHAPVVAVVATSMLLATFGLEVGYIAGLLIENLSNFDRLVDTLIFIIVAIYLLSLTLTLLSQHPESLVPQGLLSPTMPSDIPDQAGSEVSEQDPVNETSRSSDPFSTDVIEQRSYELATQYHLTPREREVMVLLTRGRTAPYIASELNISTNTVRGYIQDIYAKLDIHSKQQLMNRMLYS